jgi:DNA adenine methylase
MRYHGGKWMLAPWVISHFAPHRIYVEPFGGAASVLLRKPRCYAEVYNDLDGEIVNLFRVARDRGPELKFALELTPFSRDEFKLSYVPSLHPVEQARRTVVRSFMGFGSNSHARPTGFRSNSNRSGTTPARDWMHFPDCLDAIIERLRGVVIEHKDAAEVIRDHDGPDTLHYIDPPYVSSTRDDGRDDYRHEMTDTDHKKLADLLNQVEGMVVVSGYDCPLYRDLFAGWQRHSMESLADGARPRTECLWIRNGHPSLFGNWSFADSQRTEPTADDFPEVPTP